MGVPGGLGEAVVEAAPTGAGGVDKHAVEDLAPLLVPVEPLVEEMTQEAAGLGHAESQPVARRDFEATLEKTDALLGERGGPFFAGENPTAPDVCWAPFLERYAAQLPLLHDGLRPRDATRYPNLSRWYDSMESTTVWKSNFRRPTPSTRRDNLTH